MKPPHYRRVPICATCRFSEVPQDNAIYDLYCTKFHCAVEINRKCDEIEDIEEATA